MTWVVVDQGEIRTLVVIIDVHVGIIGGDVGKIEDHVVKHFLACA